MNTWQAYIIALAVGLLVGIEREKAHPNQSTMGIRTFVMISLLGALAGGVAQVWLATTLSAFALGLIGLSYFRTTQQSEKNVDQGLTTEFAAGVVYCLGYVSHSSPILAATLGPIVALILFSKPSLHRWTQAIKASELQAALLLILAGVVVTSLVPDRAVDPWNVFNPRKFGYIVLILATLEFSSYVLAKIFGDQRSFLIVGFLGGLASSTAVLLSSARQAKEAPTRWRPMLSSVLTASLASYAELLFIVGALAPKLLLAVLPAAAVAAIVTAIGIFLLTRNLKNANAKFTLSSPLKWKGVFRLAVLLAAILGLISAAKRYFGDSATAAVSFMTGLFELHGVSIANATMFSRDQLTIDAAATNIVFALAASIVAKLTIAWIVARGNFARVLSILSAAMLLGIALTFAFT